MKHTPPDIKRKRIILSDETENFVASPYGLTKLADYLASPREFELYFRWWSIATIKDGTATIFTSNDWLVKKCRVGDPIVGDHRQLQRMKESLESKGLIFRQPSQNKRSWEIQLLKPTRVPGMTFTKLKGYGLDSEDDSVANPRDMTKIADRLESSYVFELYVRLWALQCVKGERRVFASDEWLMEKCRVRDRQLREMLKTLRDHGLLLKQHGRGANRRSWEELIVRPDWLR